jgi:phosphopantothenoylcysteine decarboxylase/phosphopantothenate--cysteine ligase
MHILVTAGPTREPLDPVRFLSNRSSGKMGYALAAACLKRGHAVTLVSGPVCLQPPEKAALVRVLTASEMLEAVKVNLPSCHALIMAAAVADWRPKNISPRKLKKNNTPASIELEPTCDILDSVRNMKDQRVFVGFSADTDNIIAEAKRKLVQKKLDLIVSNDVSQPDSGFESNTNRVTLLSSDGSTEELPLMTKADVAEHIVEWIEKRTTTGKH